MVTKTRVKQIVGADAEKEPASTFGSHTVSTKCGVREGVETQCVS